MPPRTTRSAKAATANAKPISGDDSNTTSSNESSDDSDDDSTSKPTKKAVMKAKAKGTKESKQQPNKVDAKENKHNDSDSDDNDKHNNNDGDDDDKDDICRICNDGGSLLACDTCPCAYHPTCIGVTPDEVDDIGDFTCADIETESKKCVKRRTKRRLVEDILPAASGKREAVWVGKGQTRAGKTTYMAFKIAGYTFTTGDYVNVAMQNRANTLLAKIASLWEDRSGKHAKLIWMYFPEDTKLGRLPHHGAREVFQSSHSDTNPLTAIDSAAYVLKNEEEVNGDHGHPKEVTYFCRCHYNEDTGHLRPLNDDDTHTTGAAARRRGRPAAKSKDKTSSDHSDDSEDGDEEHTGIHASPLKVRPRAARRHQMMATIQESPSRPVADPYAAAASQLQLSAVTDPLVEAGDAGSSLPCRQVEHKEIFNWLHTAISQGGRAGGMYVSGMPGTGKTATVLNAIRQLKQLTMDKKLSAFDFIELNGMKLPDPQLAYSLLWKALKGKTVAASRAALLLDRHFSTAAKRRVCVVLLDELDYIVNRKQNVIYSFFDWPGRKHARLVVIGIANTMNLAESLMPRVGSRLGVTRLTFAPYTREQLETIVTARLRAINAGAAFKPEAIELCARLVSARSGDIRRALLICRRATEICQLEQRLAQKAAAVAATAIVATPTNGIETIKEIKTIEPHSTTTLNDNNDDAKRGGTKRKGDELSAASITSSSKPKRRQPSKKQRSDSDNDSGIDDMTSTQRKDRVVTAQVELKHIERAIKEIDSAPHIIVLAAASKLEKIVLCAILALIRTEGQEEMSMTRLLERSNSLQLAQSGRIEAATQSTPSTTTTSSTAGSDSKESCPVLPPSSISGINWAVPTTHQRMLQCLTRLADVRIVNIEPKRSSRDWLVRLLPQQDDVTFALRNDDLFNALRT